LNFANPGPGIVAVAPADRRIAYVAFGFSIVLAAVAIYTRRNVPELGWILAIPSAIMLVIAAISWQESQYGTTADCTGIAFYHRGQKLWDVSISAIDEDSCRYLTWNRWLSFRTKDGQEYRWLVPAIQSGPEAAFVRYQIVGDAYAKEIGPEACKQINSIFARVCEDRNIDLAVDTGYRRVRVLDSSANWELAFYMFASQSLAINSLDALFGSFSEAGFFFAGLFLVMGGILTFRRLRYLDRDSDIITWTGRDLLIQRKNGKALVVPNVTFDSPQSAMRAYQEFDLDGKTFRLDRARLEPVELA